MTETTEPTQELIEHDGLNDRQREAVQMLADGLRPSEVAQDLGVRRETVSRWRQQPAFRQALNARQGERNEALGRYLLAVAEHAVGELEGLLRYPHDPRIRLRAATAILELASRAMTRVRDDD